MRRFVSLRQNIHHAVATDSAASEAEALGTLPEWNLADLYPSLESAELKADLTGSRAKPRPSHRSIAVNSIP